MALPNDKITTTLVANTLGSDSRDVGTLCTHTAINKWSKWKPVRFNKVAGITESDLSTVLHGIIVPTASSSSDMIAQYNAGSIFWEYEKPRGGSQNEPYRLADFRNYEHNASRFYNVTVTNNFYASIPHVLINVDFSAVGETSINYDDLQMGDYRLGGLVRRSGTTTPYGEDVSDISFNASSDGSLSALVEFPTTNPSYDTYEVFIFFASMSGLNIAKYNLLENGKITFNHTARYSASISAYRNSNTGVISWELYLYNNSDQPVSMFDVQVECRYDGNIPGTALESGEGRTILGTISVPANSVEKRTGSFSQQNSLPQWGNPRYGYIGVDITSPTGISTSGGIAD